MIHSMRHCTRDSESCDEGHPEARAIVMLLRGILTLVRSRCSCTKVVTCGDDRGGSSSTASSVFRTPGGLVYEMLLVDT